MNTLMHADREQPARWYIQGLLLPGERKSVEPLAARVQPDNVRSAHQAMHHLVDLPWQPMIDTLMGCWAVERDDEELKQELGLGHYEGRNWRGFFHHHASLCIAAYGFLMRERLAGRKKTPLDSKRLPYPPASARAGPDPMQRHEPTSIATCRFRLARAIARSLLQCPCCGCSRMRRNL